MADTIVRYLLDQELLLTISSTTELVEEARLLHQTTPVCTAALGRTMTAALMMADSLKKDDHKITLTFNGDGPAGTVMATASAMGTVKGWVANPYVDLPLTEKGKLNVGAAIGKKGFLTVAKDTGSAEPYSGKTPLATGEIAEDITQYLFLSEQQPSLVFLSVHVGKEEHVTAAGGILCAPLPGTPEETLDKLEACIPSIQKFTEILSEKSPDDAVHTIFNNFEIEKMTESQPKYLCDCARERIEQVIISLGEDELKAMIKEDKQAEVTCRFCNKKYLFTEEDLNALLKEVIEKKEQNVEE